MLESVTVQWFRSGFFFFFLLFLLHLLVGLLLSCKLELFLLICLFNININSEILFFKLSRLFSHYLSVFTDVPNKLRFGQRELLQVNSLTDTFLSFLEHFIPFETKDISGSLSAFSAVLESAISSRSPGFFHWVIVFRNQELDSR